MIFNNTVKTLRHTALAIAVAAVAVPLTGCDAIYDDTDCYQSYNLVRFVFDHNMKFADAFDNEVDQVSVLVFNKEDGRLVKRVDAPHSQLSENNELVLDMETGNYDILTWAGRHSESFDIAAGEVGVSTLEDFHCRMRRLEEQDGSHVREDLAHLWHSQIEAVLPYASPSKPNILTVPLKKDTNTFRVVLQNINGEALNEEDFDITITDSNGWLNHDNSLRDDVELTYHPWYTYSGSVDINSNPQDPEGTRAMPFEVDTRASLGAMLAELTTGRLVTDNKPMLTVRNKKEGKVVLQVPVIDYALLVKGFYHQHITDQEYLDRQDEYNMTFFLDENNRWLSTVIIINDWRIIRYEGPIS